MSIAIAIWSIALLPGKPQEVSLESDVRITNAALGAELKDSDGRTSIKLSYARPIAPDDEDDDEDDAPPSIETTVLCSLTPGKIEQATVDLVLEGDEDYLFEVVGKNTVYLTGNYIDQSPFNGSFNGSSIADSDEKAYDLREVSSDVEVDPEDLESDPERFEELDELEEPIKTLKRPRESDAMDTDASPAAATKETEKLSKKLKGEGGKVVAAGPEADSKPSAEGETKKDKKKKKKEKKKDQDAAADGTEKETEKLKKAAGSVKTLAGGLQVKDAKVGTGSQAKKGNSLKLRYVGKLSNGTIFDKNTKGPPFKVQLGKGDVIKGWEEGLVGMQVGGERVLTVPPSMAYGDKKMGSIPANATLTFEIKLLEIN